MIFRSLRAEELNSWYDHCQSVFAHTPTGYFQRHFENDPWADLSLIYIAEDQSQIIATVRLFRRKIHIGGREISAGGIGEVSTKKEYRNEGIATHLLQIALATMKKEQMQVSFLFGDQHIYSSAGYQTYFTSWTELKRNTGSIERTKNPLIIQKACFPRDLNTIKGIHGFTSGALDGTVIRSEKYWNEWVIPQYGDVWIARSEERIVAYAAVTETGRIDEIGSIPGYQLRLKDFAREIASLYGWPSIFVNSELIADEKGDTVFTPVFMAKSFDESCVFHTPGFYKVDTF